MYWSLRWRWICRLTIERRSESAESETTRFRSSHRNSAGACHICTNDPFGVKKRPFAMSTILFHSSSTLLYFSFWCLSIERKKKKKKKKIRCARGCCVIVSHDLDTPGQWKHTRFFSFFFFFTVHSRPPMQWRSIHHLDFALGGIGIELWILFHFFFFYNVFAEKWIRENSDVREATGEITWLLANCGTGWCVGKYSIWEMTSIRKEKKKKKNGCDLITSVGGCIIILKSKFINRILGYWLILKERKNQSALEALSVLKVAIKRQKIHKVCPSGERNLLSSACTRSAWSNVVKPYVFISFHFIRVFLLNKYLTRRCAGRVLYLKTLDWTTLSRSNN